MIPTQTRLTLLLDYEMYPPSTSQIPDDILEQLRLMTEEKHQTQGSQEIVVSQGSQDGGCCLIL